MKRFLLPVLRYWLIFVYTSGQVLVPIPVLANPKGVVDCTLEWHSGRHVYTYVFSGVVSSRGKPCPNAKIQLHLSMTNREDTVQEAIASADGKYELRVAFDGAPQGSADWKLVAQHPETSAEAAEIEGRTILTEDEDIVVVRRPIQLVQG